MKLILLMALPLTIGISAYVQIRYAHANYPATWRWRLALFIPAFLTGGIFALVGFVSTTSMFWAVANSVGVGLVIGILYAFLFPYNMRRLMPKKQTPVSMSKSNPEQTRK